MTEEQNEEQQGADWVNPIDPDKVTETPGTLAYPHHAGSALVKPTDRGKLKGRAMSAMYQQTDQQLLQIKKQMELLASQAREVQQRVEISKDIYEAEMSFDPLIGHTYHLYREPGGKRFLSMLSPREWGRSATKKEFMASARLLADHTWEILEQA